MRRSVVCAILGLAVVVRGRAEACSPAFCFGGHLVPGDGVTVPANLPGLAWDPMQGGQDGADAAKLTVAASDDPAMTIGLAADPASSLLVFDRPLVEGTRYLARDANTCLDEPGPRAEFTAGPAAELPHELGTLQATARGVAPITVSADASCSTSVMADQVAIELALSADATPWRDVLHFTTLVDGHSWQPRESATANPVPGTSWRGRGADLVYRVCQAGVGDAGIAAGRHTVTMRATLPGQFTVMSSTVEIDLACPGDPPAACDDASCEDGGCSAGHASAAPGLLVVLALLRRRR